MPISGDGRFPFRSSWFYSIKLSNSCGLSILRKQFQSGSGSDNAGVIFRDWFFEAVSGTTGQIKAWNGSTWAAKPVKVWNGSTWVTKPLKRWNGSTWVTTPY